MLRNFASSTGKICQWDFPKVTLLKHFTKHEADAFLTAAQS